MKGSIKVFCYLASKIIAFKCNAIWMLKSWIKRLNIPLLSISTQACCSVGICHLTLSPHKPEAPVFSWLRAAHRTFPAALWLLLVVAVAVVWLSFVVSIVSFPMHIAEQPLYNPVYWVGGRGRGALWQPSDVSLWWIVYVRWGVNHRKSGGRHFVRRWSLGICLVIVNTITTHRIPPLFYRNERILIVKQTIQMWNTES